MSSKERVLLWGVVTLTMFVGFNVALFTGHPGLFFGIWIPTHIPAALLGAAIADYNYERW